MIVQRLIIFRDRIKGLKLRRFGKLNSTYYGKLWQQHYISAAAAVDETTINLSPAASRLLWCPIAIAIGCRSR